VIDVTAVNVPVSSNQVKQKARSLGFHLCGIAAVDDTDSSALEHLKTWLALGYQADMAWMDNPKRFDIRACMPEVQSVICVALNYYTPHQRPQGSDYAKISRYGWGRDYHKVMHKKLKALTDWLSEQGEYPTLRYLYPLS